MIRRIRYTQTEGLPALWKSQIVTTLHSIFTNLLQPHVHGLLLNFSPNSPAFDIPLTALPHPGMALGLQVASHLLTHLVLSPMEVIRTRLIALPMSHASTPSSVSLFRRMVDEEGGFSGMYFNSNLLIPSIFEHTVRPLLTLSIPLLLERQLGYSPELSPITYSLCDLSLGLGSLLILLPIETVRKRLQIQARGNAKRGKTIVRTRDRDYVGVVEAIWRIVTEETGVRRKRVMDEKDEGGLFAGIRQLYRGVSHCRTSKAIEADPKVRHGSNSPPYRLWSRSCIGKSGRQGIRITMERDLGQAQDITLHVKKYACRCYMFTSRYGVTLHRHSYC